MEKQNIKLGLMGFGTVGTGVVRIISAHQDDLQKQTGLGIEITKILVQDAEKSRNIAAMENLLTTEPAEDRKSVV